MGTQKQRLCPSTFTPATESQKWVLSRTIREELLDTGKELELIMHDCMYIELSHFVHVQCICP